MATRLGIYNGALDLCGELPLASLTEVRKARSLLDRVWTEGGVRGALEMGQWTFAMRAAQFDYNASFTAPFGYARQFTKPTDWVLTSGVFQDSFMKIPQLQYTEEQGFWFADVDSLWIKYVSDDISYGGNLNGWPITFLDYVKAYFASRIIHNISGSSERVTFLMGPPANPTHGWLHKTLVEAKNRCAMTGPTTFPQNGTWARARRNGRNSAIWADGGNQNSLIG